MPIMMNVHLISVQSWTYLSGTSHVREIWLNNLTLSTGTNVRRKNSCFLLIG